MKLLVLLLTSAILSASYLAVSDENVPAEMAKNYPSLTAHEEISKFGKLVYEAGLVNFFNAPGPFTLFAPSNSAVDKMNQKYLADLQKPENRDKLIDLVNYHVVMGRYNPSSLKTGPLKTVNGKEIQLKVEDGQITVNGAKVVQPEIVGPNGVAYVIDTVLLP